MSFAASGFCLNTYTEFFSALNTAAHFTQQIHFDDDSHLTSPEYDANFGSRFSGPEEEIAALLKAQQIPMQKLSVLPAHLTRCKYVFETLSVYNAGE